MGRPSGGPESGEDLMRAWKNLSIVAAVLAIGASVAEAQNAPANPAPPPPDPRLDIVLSNWEKAMLGVQSLSAEVKRTRLDKVFQKTEVYEGQAHYLRGGPGQTSRASLELFKKNPN